MASWRWGRPRAFCAARGTFTARSDGEEDAIVWRAPTRSRGGRAALRRRAPEGTLPRFKTEAAKFSDGATLAIPSRLPEGTARDIRG